MTLPRPEFTPAELVLVIEALEDLFYCNTRDRLKQKMLHAMFTRLRVLSSHFRGSPPTFSAADHDAPAAVLDEVDEALTLSRALVDLRAITQRIRKYDCFDDTDIAALQVAQTLCARRIVELAEVIEPLEPSPADEDEDSSLYCLGVDPTEPRRLPRTRGND